MPINKSEGSHSLIVTTFKALGTFSRLRMTVSCSDEKDFGGVISTSSITVGFIYFEKINKIIQSSLKLVRKLSIPYSFTGVNLLL